MSPRLVLIAAALGACVAARADTGAGDLAPEARLVVDAWLAAQNGGDFAAYEKLYARKFTGVRRSGARSVSLDRMGWMRDRQRMFQKPMKVSASDVKVAGTPASARVTFTQEWESGSYHDRGPKQLVIVRQEGAARIAREEMVASLKAAPAALAEEAFAFVLGRYAILDDAPNEAWATGAARIDDEADPMITSKRAAGVPSSLAALVGRKMILQSPGAADCTATVKELRIVGAVVPHFSVRQEWRDQDRSARRRADEAWALSGKYLGALLDGCTTSEAAFARGAGRGALPLVLPEKGDAALHATAVAALRKLPAWRALQKEYVAQEGKGRWDETANDADVDVVRWDVPGQPLVTVSAHAFDGCAGFGGEVFAVYLLRGGALTLVAEPDALRPAAALMLDGAPVFFGTQSWSDFGTGLQLVPVHGAARKLAIPYLDCPC